APERGLGRQDLLDEMPRRVGARLDGDRRRRHVRATVVAEPRASGVLVSTDSAVHWAPAHLSPVRAEVTPADGWLPGRKHGSNPWAEPPPVRGRRPDGAHPPGLPT